MARSPLAVRRSIQNWVELRAKDPDQRARESVLRALFLGTLSLSVTAFLVVGFNYFVLGMRYLASRLIIVSAVTIALMSLHTLLRKRHFTLASYGLLAFYFLGAAAAVWQWGAEIPTATLLFALVVMFAGILLGARYSLYALAVVVLLLIVFVQLTEAGIAHPDTSWALTSTRQYDLIVFDGILGNIALVSWLFNRSMEQSLRRAQRSEAALLRQKKLLEIKVAARTRELQSAHLERMQELYGFAELGHLGTGLLHDLSNYLAVLSLDIEDLRQERKNRSAIIRHAQQDIRRINNLISHTKHQINGEVTEESFNLADEVDRVCAILAPKATAQGVRILWQKAPDRKSLAYIGSVNHFWQVMTNIISNAIDAYEETPVGTARQVLLSAEAASSGAVIRVIDFGAGISPAQLEKVFTPFYSTKQKGMGMGLAIVKQIVEKNFGGTVTATSDTHQGTTFTVRFAGRAVTNG